MVFCNLHCIKLYSKLKWWRWNVIFLRHTCTMSCKQNIRNSIPTDKLLKNWWPPHSVHWDERACYKPTMHMLIDVFQKYPYNTDQVHAWYCIYNIVNILAGTHLMSYVSNLTSSLYISYYTTCTVPLHLCFLLARPPLCPRHTLHSLPCMVV